MKRYNYLNVSKIIDKIFKKFQKDIIISSIPYINFVKGHDKFYFLFPEIFNKNKYHEELFRKHNFFKKIVFYIRNLKVIKIKYNMHTYKNYDAIILNKLSNKNELLINRSNYYSNLNQILKNKKYKFLNIYKNLSDNQNSISDKKDKIILSKFNNLFYELHLLYKILKKKFFLEISLFFNIITLDEKTKYFFKKAISFKNISGSAYSIRLCDQLDNFLHKVKPKLFFLTIEGNSWEKILIRHIKMNYNQIKVIGVQFSTIYSNDYPMKKNIGKIYEPDVLICKNYVNFLNVKKLKIFKNSNIIYNNLEIDNKKIILKKKKYKKISCLVAPEKNITEIMAFVDLLNKISSKTNSIKFILRLHPNLSKSELSKIKKNCNSTINISKNLLKKDLSICNILLYRGSSISFDALKHGLIPIYLNNNEFNIDPIKNLAIKKYYFSNPKQFLAIIKNIKIKKKLDLKVQKYFNQKNQDFL